MKMVTKKVLNSEDYNEIQTLLQEEGVNTMVMPLNEGITNEELRNEDNIIILTGGENIFLKKGNGYYTSHYLSEVNCLRAGAIKKVNITENISVKYEKTSVETGFMNSLGENIHLNICVADTVILSITASAGADVKKVAINSLIDEFLATHKISEVGLKEPTTDEELFEVRKYLKENIDEIGGLL